MLGMVPDGAKHCRWIGAKGRAPQKTTAVQFHTGQTNGMHFQHSEHAFSSRLNCLHRRTTIPISFSSCLIYRHIIISISFPLRIDRQRLSRSSGGKNIQPACQCVICKSCKSSAQVSLPFAFSPQHCHKERSMAEVIGFVTRPELRQWRRVSL